MGCLLQGSRHPPFWSPDVSLFLLFLLLVLAGLIGVDGLPEGEELTTETFEELKNSMNPHTSRAQLQENDRRISQEEDQSDALNNTLPGPDWLWSWKLPINSSYDERPEMLRIPEGLRERVSLLQDFDSISKDHFWPNVTGIFRGKWNFTSTDEEWKTVESNSSLPLENHGSVGLNLHTKDSAAEKIKIITGTFRINDGLHGHRHLTNLCVGLHFVQHGFIVLHSAWNLHPINMFKRLPFLFEDPNFFNQSMIAVNQRIEELKEEVFEVAHNSVTFAERRKRERDKRDKARSPEFMSKCSITLFWKLKPVPSEFTLAQVIDLEHELLHPQGLPTIPFKDMSPSGFFYSSECGFIAETEVVGTRLEVFYHKSTNFVFILAILSFFEILLFLRQMKHTPSESSQAKVSILTISELAIADAYVCLIHLTTGIIIEPISKAFAVVAFFKFVLFSLLELRYLLIVWKAQRPDLLREGWDRARREISGLYTRFYGVLLSGIILFYNASPFYVNIFTFILHSFWVPQIVHSAFNMHRKPLDKFYFVFSTITRIYIPLYVFMCPRNVVGHETNLGVALGLVIYLFVQVVVLLLQDSFGPRFFLPSQFSPPQHNYKAPLTGKKWDSETGAPPVFDCVICKDHVDLNQSYMLTPCQHVFHEECLKAWMKHKMECPTCRAELPET